MPFINTKTNVTVNAAQRETMKTRFGSDIQDIILVKRKAG